MIVSDIAPVLLALAAGVALGLLYFGLLQRSVRALAASGGPEAGRWRRWLLAAAGRMALALAGFALILAILGPLAVVAALVGFLLGRVATTRAALRGGAARDAGKETRPWS